VLGLTLTAITDDVKKKYKLKDTHNGVVVVSVDRNSAAAERGIQVGDVILEIQNVSIAKPEDLQARLDVLKKEGKKSALILVVRGDEQRFIPLAIP